MKGVDRESCPGAPGVNREEFPGVANVYENTGEVEITGESQEGLDRRRFLALSAASLSLAAAAGCRRPDLEILPYAQTPDNVIPGVPHYYATSMPKPGGCSPILVESNDGRPTKIEGNPKHSASLGATDAHTQASIYDLYSPDRSKEVLKKDKDGKLVAKSWEEFDAFAVEHFGDLRKKQGEGLRFLIEDDTSPALRLLREEMKQKFPKAVWHVYEPITNANNTAADTQILNFERRCIVSLDCDFLGSEGNVVANSRRFAESRPNPLIRHALGRPEGNNRLYVIENTYTVTGAMADHRLRIPAAHVVDYAIALAKEIASRKLPLDVSPAVKMVLDRVASFNVVIPKEWIEEVATDLIECKELGIVLAGYRQPPLVAFLCRFINDLLLNNERDNGWLLPDEGHASIETLNKAINANEVKTLIVIGGNPAYNAPADLLFAESLDTVSTVIRLGLFVDETSEKANWHLPRAHYLELWGDAVSENQIFSCIQPLIAPLYKGRSALELMIQISGWDNASGYSDAKTKVYKLLQESFKKHSDKKKELEFKYFVQNGFEMPGIQVVGHGILNSSVAKPILEFRPAPAISPTNIEVSFHPSYSLFDGRYAWNAWLLELPDPITKLVWDNAALLSPKTAEHLHVKTGDMLEIAAAGNSIKIPAFILPGQADWSISLTLGWGKLRPSRVSQGGGFNVYPIRTSGAMHFTTAQVTKTGETYDLVTTQEHGTIPEDKKDDIVHDFSLEEYEKRNAALLALRTHIPEEATPTRSVSEGADPKSRFQWGYQQSDYREAGPEMKDVKRIALQTAQDVSYPQRLDGEMQWGMVIDLNTCTGCSACVIACQAENNIPIVGKNEVKLSRSMHWISLHRYFSTDTADNPTIVNQPMMCQHCEAAPCESVCPVNAAVHSPEGLNLQVYNRCIGTRYCSNNCPYKARRFNWFDFNKRRLDQLRVPTPFSEAGTPETLKMQKNPEVTVRMRGVMEKCTYCIQRIERAKIGSKVLAIKAGDDKLDTQSTEDDPKKEYRQGYAIRVLDGVSRIVVPDGIIHTACEQACPTGAIVFGNVRDTKSKVYKLKNAGPDYLVLGQLNTKPRTSYLPRLRNLNPKMGGQGGAE